MHELQVHEIRLQVCHSITQLCELALEGIERIELSIYASLL
jgi:hypothetical protein